MDRFEKVEFSPDGNFIKGGPFLPERGWFYLSNRFGPRLPIDTPVGRTGDFHFGLDINNDAVPQGTSDWSPIEGTPLVAMADGVVDIATFDGVYGAGNWVRLVCDGEPFYSVEYYHMKDPCLVRAGTRVEKGRVLGYVGTTGASTGPHLHIGVKNANGYTDPYNFLMLAQQPVVPVAAPQVGNTVEYLNIKQSTELQYVMNGKTLVLPVGIEETTEPYRLFTLTQAGIPEDIPAGTKVRRYTMLVVEK